MRYLAIEFLRHSRKHPGLPSCAAREITELRKEKVYLVTTNGTYEYRRELLPGDTWEISVGGSDEMD